MLDEQPNKLRPSKRAMTIGVNVSSTGKLPQVGRQLASFIKSIDDPVGPMDINIVVSVEPTDVAAIGPVELPDEDDDQPQIEIVMVDGDNLGGFFPEGAD